MKPVQISPETYTAIADLQELRRQRTGRKPFKKDVVSEAIDLLLNGELLLHEYKNKIADEGPSLACVGKKVIAYNMDYTEHRYNDAAFSFVVTCQGKPFRLVSAGEVNNDAIADLVARYDPQMPARPLTVKEAQESSLFHHLTSICRHEIETAQNGEKQSMKTLQQRIYDAREALNNNPSTASPVWSEVNRLSVFVYGDNSLSYAETAEKCRDFCERHEDKINCDAIADLADLFELAEKAWFDAADEWHNVVFGVNHG